LIQSEEVELLPDDLDEVVVDDEVSVDDELDESEDPPLEELDSEVVDEDEAAPPPGVLLSLPA